MIRISVLSHLTWQRSSDFASQRRTKPQMPLLAALDPIPIPVLPTTPSINLHHTPHHPNTLLPDVGNQYISEVGTVRILDNELWKFIMSLASLTPHLLIYFSSLYTFSHHLTPLTSHLFDVLFGFGNFTFGLGFVTWTLDWIIFIFLLLFLYGYCISFSLYSILFIPCLFIKFIAVIYTRPDGGVSAPLDHICLIPVLIPV